jgi:hypothetical protein
MTTKNSKSATKAVKTALEKVKPPEDASQYATMSGDHKIIESSSIIKFSEKFPIYMNSYEVLTTQYYSLSRQLCKQFEEISETQKKMAECSKHLSTMFKISNSDQLSECYQKIEEALKNWSTRITEYTSVVKENFIDFYKYMTIEKQSLEVLNNIKTTFTQNYQKLESSLSKKKEYLFKAGYSSKWELSEADMKRVDTLKNDKDAAYKAMLPRETTRLNHLRVNYLMICNQ